MKQLTSRQTVIMTVAVASMLLKAGAVSPYISKVYDFCPAPGQFVNVLPEFEDGDSHEQIITKVEEQICGDKNPGMISLGAFGGYVVFGFDHPVVNVASTADFKIYGNAFVSDQNSGGGSSEPGIVMVSVDANGNGVPDDEWYELAGSEYGKETTQKNYTVTYYRPAADKTAVPDPDYSYVNDRTYIKWSASDGSDGYVKRNIFHSQSYWPQWLADEATLQFTGTKLADNYHDESGNGTYYVQMFYDWGYADNLPNEDSRYDGFDIGNAVDAEGKTVHLPKIDFVKVYTGVNQYCGWLGETSTEICGAVDLHPDAEVSGVASIDAANASLRIVGRTGTVIMVAKDGNGCQACIYSMSGAVVAQPMLGEGINEVDVCALPSGVYILVADDAAIKFVK